MLSVISAGWIWGGSVTGVTQPLHLPSHAVLRLMRLNLMHLTFALSFQVCYQQQMWDILVCFSSFQVVQVIFLVSSCFHFLLLVFLCQVVPVFLACCVMCYCVFHGCSLFSECLWVSSWGSLMVWCCCRLLWHVAIRLYRLLIAVCRFLCFLHRSKPLG